MFFDASAIRFQYRPRTSVRCFGIAPPRLSAPSNFLLPQKPVRNQSVELLTTSFPCVILTTDYITISLRKERSAYERVMQRMETVERSETAGRGRWRAELVRTEYIFYDSEGGEIKDPAAFAACSKVSALWCEERDVVVFATSAETKDELAQAVWEWCQSNANGVDLRELDIIVIGGAPCQSSD